MPWIEVFAVFVVSHLTGDYILQTERQATRKRFGLGRDPVARRALAGHMATYALCYVPAMLWLADSVSTTTLVLTAAAIVVPHAILDDGRAMAMWMRHVKRTPVTPGTLAMMVDQSFHIVSLFAIAIAVGG